MTGDDTGGPWVPGNPNDRSVEGFRIRHGGRAGPMSRSFYYGMKRRGEGPRERHVNGKVIITPEAEAEWDAGAKSKTERAKIKKINAMRHKRALKAGAASKESPLHVSKFRLGRSKRPRSK